jgi:hypothetical protein
VVSHLIRGGSGDRSGTVKPGDIIVSIDGEDLTNRGLGVMRNSLVGPEGSSVEVGFRRLKQGEEGYMSYSVLLMRGTPGLLAPARQLATRDVVKSEVRREGQSFFDSGGGGLRGEWAMGRMCNGGRRKRGARRGSGGGNEREREREREENFARGCVCFHA